MMATLRGSALCAAVVRRSAGVSLPSNENWRVCRWNFALRLSAFSIVSGSLLAVDNRGVVWPAGSMKRNDSSCLWDSSVLGVSWGKGLWCVVGWWAVVLVFMVFGLVVRVVASCVGGLVIFVMRLR